MRLFTTTITLFLAIVTLGFTSCKNEPKSDTASNIAQQDDKNGIFAEIKTTKGTMLARLFYKKVPVTVANFIALAEGTHPKLPEDKKGKPYYNGISFHRVMDKFMIQGGDPTATGTGNPGYRFASEFDKDLKHDKPGVLSMANSGGINTNGSQFFITEVPYPSLDFVDANGAPKPCNRPRVSCHSVFGQLIKGIEVQDSISNVQVDAAKKPLEDVIMTEVNIIRVGEEAKAFDAVKVFTEQEPTLVEKYQALTKEITEEYNKKAKEEAKEAIDDFIEKYQDMGELYKSPTGMVMVTTQKSTTGEKPTSSNYVKVNCTGMFTNGKVFYTTYKEVAQEAGIYNQAAEAQGAYVPFPTIYNESATLVPAFKEALLRMKVGEKTKVFVPSYLGYGSRNYGPIPANSNLVFDIELVEIDTTR
ncbi:cyclophilin family peptidyl-prolyl cis-trans isomerase [Kordia periserrulae]|uniref:peptidylprolyl isomerase n=1 Tax=Kordia periserrulae TaxID=701523 RepID=A0A2T6C0Y8_9FLAO|nr:peptidylprolyl isomerase [Kordia periserrulae]PTX61976.1 cyclophilin family peptidyl-prolyl cis-trans isomerase [Kordia periserrulae]